MSEQTTDEMQPPDPPAFQLTARVLQLQDDRATPIEADQVEGVLAEVDTDRGDRGWCRIA